LSDKPLAKVKPHYFRGTVEFNLVLFVVLEAFGHEFEQVLFQSTWLVVLLELFSHVNDVFLNIQVRDKVEMVLHDLVEVRIIYSGGRGVCLNELEKVLYHGDFNFKLNILAKSERYQVTPDFPGSCCERRICIRKAGATIISLTTIVSTFTVPYTFFSKLSQRAFTTDN